MLSTVGGVRGAACSLGEHLGGLPCDVGRVPAAGMAMSGAVRAWSSWLATIYSPRLLTQWTTAGHCSVFPIFQCVSVKHGNSARDRAKYGEKIGTDCGAAQSRLLACLVWNGA
jgi:hypothetical protein